MIDVEGLQEVLTETIGEVRTALADKTNLPHFTVRVEASGRVHEGEVKLAYSVRGHTYEDGVQGFSIQAVLDEYIRQNNWNALNAPLALTFNGDPDV